MLEKYKTIGFAILGGIIPALFWLWFWLREEDEKRTESALMIILTFILGGLLVFIAIWLERDSLNFIRDNTTQVIVWATIEELLKVSGILLILKSANVIRKPIDYPIYFISIALGFAAIENTLYLIQPIRVNGTVVGMLTGNLRFLGSTLLHAIASGMVGSAFGLSFYLHKHKIKYVTIGITLAIVLHSTFNFFIMKGDNVNFMSVFGFLWVVVIINILIFEKIRCMGKPLLNYVTK